MRTDSDLKDEDSVYSALELTVPPLSNTWGMAELDTIYQLDELDSVT